MRVLDLFSGIGGFSLGLERAGMETVAFCEIDPYCRKVLAKHWPGVPIHNDIKELGGAHYRGAVDIVCGGFPCQDISPAGTRRGIDGDRSGLWSEMFRVVSEVRPDYVIVENSSELVRNGLHRVLRDLASIGLDADWSVVSACSLGYPHMRERLYLVAYPNGKHGGQGVWGSAAQKDWTLWSDSIGEHSRSSRKAWLEDSPALYGGADGISRRVDRLRALGNAVVPQIPEAIGRAIMSI